MSPERSRAIGLTGTVTRVVVGLGLLFLAMTNVKRFEWGLQWYEALLGLVVFPGVVLLWHGLRSRYSSAPLRATGALGTLINTGVVVALFVAPFTRDAAALFYGSSMLLAAWRGYAGCEMLAISNVLLRRNDEVGCAAFSPVDSLERRLTGKA